MLIRVVCLVCILVAIPNLSVGQGKSAPSVTVKGRVLTFKSDESYEPFARAKVQAFRGGPVLLEPVKSIEDGTFEITIPGRSPFRLAVYAGQDFVPVVIPLAGGSRTKPHDIDIALLNDKQYVGMAADGSLPPLPKALVAIDLNLTLTSGSETQLRAILDALKTRYPYNP